MFFVVQFTIPPEMARNVVTSHLSLWFVMIPPAAFTLSTVCMAVQSHSLAQRACLIPCERYTICSWPGKHRNVPMPGFHCLMLLMRSGLQVNLLRTHLPVQPQMLANPSTMPMAAQIMEPDRFCSPESRVATRQRYGLPSETVLFGFSFDLNSTAIRKNPMGALEAFQKAFPLSHLPASFGDASTSHPLSEHASLVIKTFPPQSFSPEWHWLVARAEEDSRIVLIADSLPRDELLSLYGCCDVFLSLHRSEGFGRGIAEALQLGLDVIATDFGGNTDFCTGPLSHPVRWRKVPISRGSYPDADGHYWAEPDLDHAAELCQEVAARRNAIVNNPHALDPSRDSSVLTDYRNRFSFMHIGNFYRKRLQAVLND